MTDEQAELGSHAAAFGIDPEKLRQLIARWGLLPMLRLGRDAATFRAKSIAAFGETLVDAAMAGKINGQNVGGYGLLNVLSFTTLAAEFGTTCVMNHGEPMMSDCIAALS